MDIKTRGIKVFRIIEVLREVPNKLYSAAIVYELEQSQGDTGKVNPTLINLINQLH